MFNNTVYYSFILLSSLFFLDLIFADVKISSSSALAAIKKLLAITKITILHLAGHANHFRLPWIVGQTRLQSTP